ncbi:hypothetical protein Salat_0851800 [Sesamum alatum]|uniref:Retroviral polymerase SH3-like domain-containing protein n=1 Tax=Sesamum alatum TaxID=300844 RepID=A0AAE1YIU3_9LAMI|nr:hypothetical protein Salat_0851800 [Sesamum alatum]
MEEEAWNSINRLACGTIRSCLSKEHKYTFSKEIFVHKLWTTLEERFLKKNIQNKLYMKKRLFRLSYVSGTTMNDHIANFNQLMTDLMNMDEMFKDDDLALMFLRSLSFLKSLYSTGRMMYLFVKFVQLCVRYTGTNEKSHSVGTLESKGFELRAKDSVMKIISSAHVVMKGIRKNNNLYHYSRTPLEKWFSKPATDYESLHLFSSTAYYHVKESKLDQRAKRAIFLGITLGIKGYRLWCLKTKKIIFSRDVNFDESTMLAKVDVEQLDDAPKQVEFERVVIPTNEATDEDSSISEGKADSDGEEV